MRYLLLFIFTAVMGSSYAASDSTHMSAPNVNAHKYTLLNFSGSDWCIPCIKMKKAIFLTDTFKTYAVEHITWINADFPRDRKSLSKEQVKKNEALADKYNKKGSFPYTVLLDEKGNIIKSWDGFPNLTAEEFVHQVDDAVKNDEHQHS